MAFVTPLAVALQVSRCNLWWIREALRMMRAAPVRMTDHILNIGEPADQALGDELTGSRFPLFTVIEGRRS